MTDVDESTLNPHGEAAASSGPSAGELLRQAREAAGLHIAALAVSLKVPVKKLEALEAGRFDLLPDAVFVRALASSVCRSLKIDATPILERLPHTSAPKLIYQGVGINTPFRAPGDGPGPSAWTQVSRPAVLAGMVLLLAALVLIMLPALKNGVAAIKGDQAAAGTAATPEAARGGDTFVSAPVEVLNSPAAAVSAPAVALLPASAAPSPGNALPAAPAAPVAAILSAVAAAPLPAASAPLPAAAASRPGLAAAVPAPAASAAVAPPRPATGIVVFSAKGESWVEVKDARGVVVLRRTLAAGDVAGASGALPLVAVVGRADATQVQVRGKALDLGPLARDNVARFEVK